MHPKATFSWQSYISEINFLDLLPQNFPSHCQVLWHTLGAGFLPTKTEHLFTITHQDQYKKEAKQPWHATQICSQRAEMHTRNTIDKEKKKLSPEVLETHKIISFILRIGTQNSFIRRGINKSDQVKELQSDKGKRKRNSIWDTRKKNHWITIKRFRKHKAPSFQQSSHSLVKFNDHVAEILYPFPCYKLSTKFKTWSRSYCLTIKAYKTRTINHIPVFKIRTRERGG